MLIVRTMNPFFFKLDRVACTSIIVEEDPGTSVTMRDCFGPRRSDTD